MKGHVDREEKRGEEHWGGELMTKEERKGEKREWRRGAAAEKKRGEVK